MSDIEKSFTFLQDSIPQWLQDIARVEEKATAMQDQVTKFSVSHSSFAKRKSESIESIQTPKLPVIAEEAAPSNGAQTDPLGNRKRKTLSVLSGRASNPLRYRPKQMVVVSYDGEMQKSFEILVRAIGTGRNMLRKAKMEAKLNELAALAGGSSEDEDEAVEEEEGVIVSKITYRPRMSSMRARATARRGGPVGVGRGSNAPVELFDTTDKILEHAQCLCEKAAHLTLRDGDCRKELEDVRKNFEAVLDTAKTQVVECNAMKLQGPREAHLQDNSDPSVPSLLPSPESHPSVSTPPPGPRPKGMLPEVPLATALTVPKLIEIEVDDDEEEDEEVDFVMPPVRLTSRLTGRA
ncbi:Nn.00g114290.m01.CDS01 [Neocucurbitaria sp. VM-36]